MDIALFAVTVVTVSTSGVLSPGPLTIASAALGVRGSLRSGLLVALGHTLFELPYVATLIYLLSSVRNALSRPDVKVGLSAFMAVFMAFFIYLLVKDIVKGSTSLGVGSAANTVLPYRNPVVVGFAFTALNVYFLIWWATVGLVLIEGSLRFGTLQGLAIMYPLHVWMDFAWLGLIAYASHKGAEVLGPRGTRVLLGVLASILTYFTASTLYNIVATLT